MAKNVRIELNSKGVRQLLHDPGVLADLERRAKRIAAAAGEGMETDSDAGGTRARAVVITATRDAQRAEATDRALTRAVDAGR